MVTETTSIRLAESIAEQLGDRSLACAESVTAGRVAATLACVEGAVEFFRGGTVVYQESMKRHLLDVRSASVLSLEAAEEMALGATRLLHADAAVATTGLAGHAAEDGVPGGTVFIATCVDGQVRSTRHHFDDDPERVCAAAAEQALADLLQHLTARDDEQRANVACCTLAAG